MGAVYDYLLKNNQLTKDEPKREDWLLAGLIHDIDYSGEFKADHPRKTLEVLAKYGLTISETVHNIVKAHAPEKTATIQKIKRSGRYFMPIL
jgi:predicted hydrolase (HD superfamily)